MAEEEKDSKTEEATPKRLEEARMKGQVAYSSETVATIGLCALVMCMTMTGGGVARAAGELVQSGADSMGRMGTRDLQLIEYVGLMREAVGGVFPAVMMLILPVLAVVALTGFGQVGVKIATKALKVDPTKINPVKGIQKVLSWRGVVRTVLAAGKVTVAFGVVILVASTDIAQMTIHAGDDLGPALSGAGEVIFRSALAAVLALTLIALFDLWYQKYQFAKDMRMSKKERKEEHKASEGDPIVKPRIRNVQREMSARRMMADVPDATVVVTNPTHFAVALRYEEDSPMAPKVIAKGVDEVAQNIKRVAREAGVVVVEEPPLARALHRTCEIGDEIPEDLFGAVAGVLAYVYRVQGEPARA